MLKSPVLKQLSFDKAPGVIEASHKDLGKWMFTVTGANDLLFTNNETNTERLWGSPNQTPYTRMVSITPLYGTGKKL